jgi:type IX secretion system PorP/SprF family membrane protein
MKIKQSGSSFKIVLLTLSLICIYNLTYGQESPYHPVSHRIFNPSIINPAAVGSKDFTTIDLLVNKYGTRSSLLAGSNGRLSKPGKSYVSSFGGPEFTNIGVGGYIFNETNEISRILGICGSASYHFQMDDLALSFLSVGLTGKALFNSYDGNTDLSRPPKNTFIPNFDLGVYYYSPYLFGGISATNILGKPAEPDSLGYSTIPLSSHFALSAGGRIIISKTRNILIEPSVFFITDASFSGDVIDMIKPAVKLYAGKFCIGTYFNNFDNTSFFFQFKYPKFHIGAYFETQNKSPFYKTPPITELSVGINISAIKSGVSRANHW